ncbi:DUF2304 family protein [Candidatus Woesearchaeota archaeon]|nr:DUF2304 family protein [Candidatus Woesearchaeota archaeon]
MTILQLLILIFSFFALSRVILRTRDKKLTLYEFIFWVFVWASVIFIAFFPGVSTFFANLVGIDRGVDILIYSGIGLLFYLIFRLYVKLEELEQEFTVLVREISFIKKKEK